MSYQIVGVVADAVYRRAREGVVPTVYLPLAQLDEIPPALTFAVGCGMALPPPALTGSGSRVVAPSGHLSARSAELPCDTPA